MFRKNTQNLVLTALLIGSILIMWAATPRQFLTIVNLQSIAFQFPELAILALAMMITMISGGINLSIIASANLNGIITIMLFHVLARQAGLSLPVSVVVSMAAGLAASLAVGFTNGILIGIAGVSPILCTLGMMTFVNGFNVLITRGYTISEVPKALVYIGNGIFLGLPLPVIVFALCALGVSIMLNRTVLGYSIYMIGSNMTATRYAGINNSWVIIRLYALSAFIGSVASFVMMGRFNSVSADYGQYYLLLTVLSSVLGGTSATGGFGKVFGLVLAVVILQIIASGLNLMKADPYLGVALWGAIMIAVMAANFVIERARR